MTSETKAMLREQIARWRALAGERGEEIARMKTLLRALTNRLLHRRQEMKPRRRH